LTNIDKMLKIAEDMFDGETVSIGTKHPLSKEITVLLAGRVEFNSYKHRRDAFDVMLHYDLYVKREGDHYIAGRHNEVEQFWGSTACEALTEAAYRLVVK